LPAPAALGEGQGYIAPEGEIEARIAGLWQQLLQCGPVGRCDNFFELGGNSLLALQMLSRANDALRVGLTLDQVFSHRTVSRLAECVTRASRLEPSTPLTSSKGMDVRPLSYSQRRLWFLTQLEGPNPTYNIPKVFALAGDVDIPALQKALQVVVDRHESLRTSFRSQNGKPHLVIDERHVVVLQVEDAETSVRWDELCGQERRHCFDLNRGPLYRVKLVRREFDTGGNPYHLLATFHHSIFDGLSSDIFAAELAILYRACAQGRRPDLPALPVQFSDFALWQHQRHEQGEFAEQANYWRQKLVQLTPYLHLPTDRARTARRSQCGSAVQMNIDEVALARLRALAHERNATLYMALLAAFAIVLNRYSGQSDIAIGSPVANRSRREFEHLLGFFVNTVVMRCKASDEMTFLEVLDATRAVVLEGLEHQDIPFDLVVESVNPARSLSTSPLFQVMFALQGEDSGTAEVRPWIVDLSRSGIQTSAGQEGVAHFDLTLLVNVSRRAVHCTLEYATDLFDSDTVRGILESYVEVVDRMGRSPRKPIADFEIIGAEDRQRQTVTWAHTAATFPIGRCVHELFEDQVARTPEAIALVFEEESISFRELNNRANYLAHALLSRGVRPESRIGLFFQRSIEMVVGMLAAVKAGGCYVPLDPGHPAERTALILADARVEIVLSNVDLPELIRSASCSNIDVAHALRAGDYQVGASYTDIPRSRVGLTPDNLAYCLYTSGTTGRPKGVMIRHSSLCNLCQDSIQRRGFNGECRNLQFAPLGFDAASAEVFNSLLSGSILHIPTSRILGSADEFRAYSKRHGVNRGYIPPAFLAILDKAEFASYRSLSVGGEAIPKETARQWSQVCTLTNAYGPTECTIACTSGTLDGVEDVSIGTFVANVSGYVLNDALQLVPAGVVGELCVGGECLARGYVHDRRLTAEKFIPDPFTARAGSRLYRTGDLVRYRKNGKLEFIGRKDQQVKLRGYRIELGEIEARMTLHPRIKAAVAAVQGEDTDRRLVLYYVTDVDVSTAIEATELRAFAQQGLPGYMVPSAFTRLGALPLTPNGKVDRNALPLEQFEQAGAGYVSPEGELEQHLADLWATALGVPRVGRFDNFFDLGGHSLLVTQLIAQTRESLGLRVAVRDLFENQTIERFAAAVSQQGLTADVVPATTRDSQPTPALSAAQRRLWFLHQLMGPNAVFNIPIALEIRGNLDRSRLIEAIDRLVARHDSLRTRFQEIDGEPLQIVDLIRTIRVSEEEATTEAELQSLCRRERRATFDLSDGPLCRFCLILMSAPASLDRKLHVLHITLHHIIADGQSVVILLRELFAHYNRTDEELTIAALPLKYRDFIEWQNGTEQKQQWAPQVDYWRETLAGLPPELELPLNFPRPQQQTFAGATRKIRIGPQTCQHLKRLSHEQNATLFMTLISAFALLLGRHARQWDFAIGTPVSHRELPGTQQLIGLFLNSLVLRFRLDLTQSFVSLLRSTRQTAIGAYRHQDVPFETLVEQLRPERSASRTPFFQVSFSLVEYPLKGESLQGVDVALLDPEENEGVSHYDITFNLAEAGAQIIGTMEFNTDLFESRTIERLLEHYRLLLEAVVAEPDKALGEVGFLSAPERQQQLMEWNRTQQAYPRRGVHQLFEEQAARQPDAIAVVEGSRQLSYGELESRANRLAHYLLERGVQRDSCVGLCVERSVDMVVGLLGILKAGGAYVPLDPGYPASRLQQMIASSGCGLILSEQHLLEELPLLSEYATLPLDGRWHEALLGGYPASAPQVPVAPDQLAYVIFTSGSTGVPKGVLISHANVVSLVATQDCVAVGSEAVVGQAASQAFDAITYELWAPLVRGARVVMIDKATLLSPVALQECLLQQQVTTLFITTALFNRISQEVPAALASVEKVLFGGEAYSAEAIAQVLRSGAPQQLLHVYGPTESTTFATGFELRAERFLQDRQAPIGMPLANTTAYVLQAESLAPLGAVGELCLGGEGLARGYLGDAQLTARKFVPHPFARSPGERLYRTGDLVRLRADGALDFVGRVDDQVKVRGFRIELGEIEQALQQHPCVDQVLVLVREDRPGERHLVAYIVPRDAPERLAVELAQHLKGRIPEYALPSAFVLLESFPLNHNGKIDRPRLPVPDESAYARAQYVAARSEMEARLVELWQENLGRERVGIEDNYFAIGGDSIRSISLVSAAKGHGLQFAIKDLFAHPTIAQLAAVVRAGQTEARSVQLIAPFELLSASERARVPSHYQGQPVEDAYPLSMLQQGMWFHSLQDPDLSLYVDVVTYRLPLPWDVQCFETCLRHLLDEHAVLRTVFVKQGHQYLQFVKERHEPELRYIDSRHVPADDRQGVIKSWVTAERHRGLSSPDALWRMTVHHFDAQTVQLTLVVHHALLDGWSVAALYSELYALYVSYHRTGSLPGIIKPPPHQHFVRLEHDALGAGAGELWRARFRNARLPWWTGARKTPSVRVFCTVSEADVAGIRALANRLEVSERGIWCAVYLALVAGLSGSRQVVGSIVTHGRPEIPGAQKTLGLFLNTLPITSDLRSGTWEEWVRSVEAELRGIHAQRHYPVAQVQVETGLDFSASLFNFTNFHVENKLDVHTDGGFDENNFLLVVNVRKDETRQRYHCAVNLEPTVFGNGVIERVPGYVKQILALLTRKPSCPIDLSEILPTVERRRQLTEWLAPESSIDTECNAAHMIKESVGAAPDAIAVSCDGQHYSYRVLDAVASAVARILRSRGLDTSSRVGICLQRSFDMLAAVLGCLKAGICYVPLDPLLPPARMAYIAQDADLDLLIGDTDHSLAHAVQIPVLDLTRCDCSGQEASDGVDVHPGHLAYVIYTSGSTGKPKGVGVSHGNLINFIKATKELMRLQHGARLLAVTTLSFDIAFLELIVPLTVAGTVAIAHADDVYDGRRLLERLAALRISCMQATPSTWKLMLESGWSEKFSLQALVGGEALAPELAQKLRDRVELLVNMYGPTETTVWSLSARIDDPAIHIGRPLRNTSAYVLSDTLDLLPTGAIGELYLGGAGVARGYVNRPALTAERFIPNPFAGESAPGSRLYRTGDLVRYLDDGRLEYLGRADQQVKLRGYRIELDEIASVILQVAGIKDAVAMVREDEPGNPYLAAYLIAHATAHDSGVALGGMAHEDRVREVRSRLEETLPSYMVPSFLQVLESFPLTPNGKLDRKALPGRTLSAAGAGFVAPLGELETRVAAIWAEILKRSPIGRHDNFFELGGHSLLAMQFVVRVEGEFGIAVALKELYRNSSLAGIAGRIERLTHIDALDEDELEKLSDDQVAKLLGELEALEGKT
jgi:amino acid adenylation domain-containing protein